MTSILHPDTEKTVAAISRNMPQALLLTGESGTGLFTIAKSLSPTRLSIVQPLDTKGEVDEKNGLISVEMTRKLYEQTRTKQIKNHIVLIDNVDRMSNSAQAAFLKLLEEPGKHIHFVLTSHNPQRILPTIHSRVEHLHIRPITKAQTMTLIQDLGVEDAKKVAQLLFIAEGLPAELHRLVNDEAYFSACALRMGDARNFLQAGPYDKMRLIQKYKNGRAESISLVNGMIRILRRNLSSHPQYAAIRQLDLLLDIHEKLLMNFNVSLQLARFVL